METQTVDIASLNSRIQEGSSFLKILNYEMDKVIVGQRHMSHSLLIALLSNGHILLEGVPGLAKTLAIKSLAQAISASFSRIQFTPDLLPADVVGTVVYNPGKDTFTVKQGPVFAHFILADEINRAPAKVQSALLEAMQERQVTIGDQTYKLPVPFMVLATQNPVEQEGTYPLPEAQVDRFMLKVKLDYPTRDEERKIIQLNLKGEFPSIQPVVTTNQILEARKLVQEIYMDDRIQQYIVDLVFATRYPEEAGLEKYRQMITFGGSPRASISLAQAARAHAFLQSRGYVIPEDVRAVCPDVLRHRIGLSFEAEAENISTDDLITEFLNHVEVP